jgi:hypothetical protein
MVALVIVDLTFRMLNDQCSGSQGMLHGSQGIHNQFRGDPRLRFCNGYFEVYLFFN